MTTKKGSVLTIGFRLLIILTLANTCGVISCAPRTFTHPNPIVFEYPVYTSVEQISNEYKTNSAGADAKYKNKRVVFNPVEVDNVHAYYYQSGGAIAVPMVDYFSAGIVRFELMDARGVQQRVQVGYILILDGICQGLVGDMVRVGDCWVGSIQGDLGIGLPAVGQY
jgi:hypothetical protein